MRKIIKTIKENAIVAYVSSIICTISIVCNALNITSFIQ